MASEEYTSKIATGIKEAKELVDSGFMAPEQTKGRKRKIETLTPRKYKPEPLATY